MMLLDSIINHWEGLLSVISIVISIVIYRKQSKLSKRLRLSEIEQKLSEAKNNKERALSNKGNHQGQPFCAQEVGRYFEKKNEYDSDVECYENIIKDLEAQKRKLQ